MKRTTKETIEIEVTIHWDYDSDYGSDADGNRGVGVWSIDDYEIDSDIMDILIDGDFNPHKE